MMDTSNVVSYGLATTYTQGGVYETVIHLRGLDVDDTQYHGSAFAKSGKDGHF